MKRENTSSVGFDRNYKEIFPGDIIQDYSGKKYEITDTGLAKSVDGTEVKLSSLHGPELVVSHTEDGQVVCHAVKEPMRPKTTVGYVAISAIAREIDVPARGCVEAVRAAGIEIKKVKSTSLVRKEDKDSAKTAILAHFDAAKASPGKTDRPKAKAVKKTPEKAVEIPEKIVEACQENPVIDEAMKNLTVTFPASDELLVAELRRRGWTVTCKKMVEVTL